MSGTISIHEAKSSLSKLLKRVALGEEIVIAKAGKPVARLVPFGKRSEVRRPGSAKGLVTISKDFDAPLPRKMQKIWG